MKYNLISVLGTTAAGKTKLAAEIAYHYNGEIISADSRQVYRGMDLGTGKDYDDYIVNNTKIKYNLVDILDPSEDYSVYEFQKNFFDVFSEITGQNKIPVLCGGTNLYIHSVLKKYDMSDVKFNSKDFESLMQKSTDDLKKILLETNKSLHNSTDLTDKERIAKAILVAKTEREQKTFPQVNSLNICVDLPREEIKKRITSRLKSRLNSGMIEEVKTLLESGKASYERLNYFGLEYKFIGCYLKSELNYNDMFQKLNSAIHAFAKRQSTWLRKMEREGIILNRINNNNFDDVKKIIDAEL